ncbi:hypothetical protein KGD82_27360 [Nocardiopsis eucommiae]|uniref:Lipoprotein n=1 Tax=Nocardiopsis eucommiae TaxID=2831970 RepID=A0A975L9X3_9ACTN|nr:hypothetical protein KGD82_27360 [Nocardiopsis eucommiae]
MNRRIAAACVTSLALVLTGCTSGTGQKTGTEETITEDEAADKAQEHIDNATAVLPDGAELEDRNGVTTASCDDPTDGGPKERVTVSVNYWIRGLAVEDNEANVDLLHEYWTANGYQVLTDSRPDDLYVSVGHEEDSFVVSVQESNQGSLSMSAASPCVWPDGEPSS